MPEIMEVEMDRGYKPKALLYPFPLNYITIALGVYRAKKYLKNAGGNDTFKTEDWALDSLEQIAELPDTIIKINLNQKMFNQSLEMEEKGRFLTYMHIASIKQFLNMIEYVEEKTPVED